MTKRAVSVRQLELLLGFLEQHRFLALGRVRGKERSAVSKSLWAQCTEILNADISGPRKSVQFWKKYFNQYKSRTLAKFRTIKQGHTRTPKEPPASVYLTPLEERLYCILRGSNNYSAEEVVKLDPIDASVFDPLGGNSADDDGSENINVNLKLEINQTLDNDNDLSSCDHDQNDVGEATTSNEDTDHESENKDKVHMGERENIQRPLKRRHKRSSTTSKEIKECKELTMEEARVEVDKGLVKATNRQAAAIEALVAQITRFVDIYAASQQQQASS